MKEMQVFDRRWGLAACGLMAAVLTGCGKSGAALYPATGTVTLDGKPVEGAQVTFVPQQGAPCLGTTDSSGKYTMTSRGQPGIPAGTYSVTVVKLSGGSSAETEPGEDASKPTAGADGLPSDAEMQKMMEGMNDMGKMMQDATKDAAPSQSLLPYQYSLPEDSGLSAIVTTDASQNVFDFALVP